MSRIYLSGSTFRSQTGAALRSLPDLQASSWLSVLSPAAASTQSSPFSDPRSFPPPGYLVSRCLRPSPLRASSLERNRLTPVNKWDSYARVILIFKQVVQGQQTTAADGLLVWFVSAGCSAATAASFPAPRWKYTPPSVAGWQPLGDKKTKRNQNSSNFKNLQIFNLGKTHFNLSLKAFWDPPCWASLHRCVGWVF